MRLRATIGTTERAPLMDGSVITLRRPVSSASIVLDDYLGIITPPSMLDPIEIKINNDCLWSENLSKSAWLKSGVSVGLSGTLDPLWGLYNTYKVTESAANIQHFIYQRFLGDLDSENAVWSCYLKAAGRSTARLVILQKDHATTRYVDVDLSVPSVTPGPSALGSITAAGGGWYRVNVRADIGSGANDAQGYVFVNQGTAYMGDGSSGLLLWGCQWQAQESSLDGYNRTLETSTVFDGFVTGLEIEKRGKSSERALKLSCLDWNWRLDNPPGAIEKAYNNKSDQAIILDALTACGLNSSITATTSTVASVSTGLTLAFDGATMREVLDEVSNASGAVWWIQNRTLYYQAEASTDAAAWAINTDSPSNPASWDVQNLRVVERQDFPLNSVEVVGPSFEGVRPSATDSDATSISAIGTYHRKIEIKSVTVDSFAAKVADQLVEAGKDPRKSIRFTADDRKGRQPLTSVNQAVTATSSLLGLSSDDFVIREIRIRQENDPYSHFEVDAGDAQPDVQGLLRRLEAASRSTKPAIGIGALDFDAASSEAVNSGTSIPNIDDLGDLTIFATIRCDSIASARTIVAKENGSNLGWTLTITAAGLISLVRTRASSNYIYSRTFGFEAGQVYRIVAVSSASTGTKFWVNGILRTSGGSQSVGGGAFDSEASQPLRVGRDNGGAYFDGAIGAVALWDEALPDTTAAALHNVSFNALPFPNALQLAWPLDEWAVGATASSGSAFDRSNNEYNGTPANGPTGDRLVYVP